MNYKKVFIRLLKDFKCYHQFLVNFKKYKRYIVEFNDNDKSLDHFIELSLKKRKSGNEGNDIFFYFINDAFEWSQTEEKFDYWSNISHLMLSVGRRIEEIDCHKEDPYSEKEIDTLRKILY